jgi:hypothetical protein
MHNKDETNDNTPDTNSIFMFNEQGHESKK